MSEQSPTATAPAASATAPLWRNRPYTLLMGGRTTEIIGAGVGTFAVPLVAFGITGSVALAGLIAAVGEAGSMLATLPAGVVSDRVDRRRLLVGAACAGALLWAYAAVAGIGGWLGGGQLAAVLFGVSVVTAVFGAADTAAIRAVVPPARMASAMAAVQGRGAVAAIIAGPLGGLLYAVGRTVPFGAGAIGQAAVAVCTALIRVPLNGDLAQARAAHPIAQFREGLRFVASVRLLRTWLWFAMLINLTITGALTVINLELVRTHTAPLLIGLLDLVAGVVMLGGSFLAGPLMRRIPAGPLALTGLGLIAACVVGMAGLHSYPGYLVLMGAAVLLLPAINAGIGGYVAAIVPERLQGRVSSVMSLGYLLIGPAAPVAASQLLAHFGVVAALWVFALALALGVAALVGVREVRRIGRPDSWAADRIEWPPVA